jgi:hypothetical protein
MSHSVVEGQFIATVLPSGRILFRVTHTDAVLEVTSSILQISEPTSGYCLLSWKHPDYFTVYLGRSMIASLSQPELVPTIVIVPGVSNVINKDFASQNDKSSLARKGKLTGSHRKPGRIHEDETYLFNSLRTEVAQLHDLLELMGKGSLHHAAGVAARLRLMIVAGEPLPLVQMCAAILDKPLIMFTESNPARKLSLPIVPSFRLAFNGSPFPKDNLQNSVDLDVWLGLGASQIGENSISNRELLKAIGDTVGAHLDRDVHPAVSALRKYISEVPAGTVDMLVQYVGRAAELIIHLSERLLAQHSAP